jgi:2-amino-4-hydroxy-6-hydroxymethyldihydropteridine diphosphokinase
MAMAQLRPDDTPVAADRSGMDNEGMHAGVVLGLGSNLGDREAAIAGALDRLAARGFRRSLLSSLFLTAPVGGPPQGLFLNAVAAGETALSPEELLAACLAIERELGRVRTEPNGPRTIDIDILLFGDLRRDGPTPVIPHPRMHERRFVLEPLAEILPDRVHPVLGRSARELLASCPDRSEVRRLTGAHA